MRILPLALVAALATVAIAAPVFAADSVEITIRPEHRGATTVEVRQDLSDEKALKFRTALAALTNDTDGNFSAEDVATVEAAAAQELRTEGVGLLTIDGSRPTVGSVSVRLGALEGPVSRSDPLTVEHTFALDPGLSPLKRHAVMVSPIRNGTLHVELPAGWTADGERGSIERSLVEGQNVTLGLVPAVASVGMPVPAPTLAASLAAILVAGAAFAVRRRR